MACLPRAYDADAIPVVAFLQLAKDVEDDWGIMDLLEEFGILGVGLSQDAGSCLLNQSKLGIQIGVFLPGVDHGGNLRPYPFHTAQFRTGGPEDRRGGPEPVSQPPHPYGPHLGKHIQDDRGLGVGHLEKGFRLKTEDF